MDLAKIDILLRPPPGTDWSVEQHEIVYVWRECVGVFVRSVLVWKFWQPNGADNVGHLHPMSRVCLQGRVVVFFFVRHDE